ncbi:MAG: RNA-directed DNA polymerase, partial [Gammaproteobacteria bacterium]|nr:RNA-directed DNA polymerase [Gammaproteobacteria bacterium]
MLFSSSVLSWTTVPIEATDVYIEPNYDKLFAHQLGAISCVQTMDDSRGYVWLVNRTNYPIPLYEGTTIGQAEIFEQGQLNTISGVSTPEVQEDAPRIQWTAEDVLKHIDFSKCDQTLTASNKEQLVNMITEFDDIFSKHERDRGRTTLVQHRIQTEGPPFKLRPYPVPYSKRPIMEEHVQQQLDDGIIEPSSSPYASPVLLVKKKNSTMDRFCVDFRVLNSQTVKDSYPLILTQDVFMSLNGNQFMSKLDISAAYWQVEVAP